MTYEQPPTRPACGHESLDAHYDLIFGHERPQAITLTSIACKVCGDVLYRKPDAD